MGFAAARCLAEDGARVAVVGRTQTCSTGGKGSVRVRAAPTRSALVADITDAEQVQRVFDEVSERWDGELNVLVNAAVRAPWAPSKISPTSSGGRPSTMA